MYKLRQLTNCIVGLVGCVVSAPFLTVMSYRTLTFFEIHNKTSQGAVVGHYKIVSVCFYT